MVLALKRPNVVVTVVDKNTARIAAWNSETLPFSEPRLLEIVKSARDGSQTSTMSLKNNKHVENGFYSRRQICSFPPLSTRRFRKRI